MLSGESLTTLFVTPRLDHPGRKGEQTPRRNSAKCDRTVAKKHLSKYARRRERPAAPFRPVVM